MTTKLQDELALPAYSGLSDGDATALLNDEVISRHRATISGNELLEAQDPTEFIALSDAKKAQWLALCSMNVVDPYGAAADIGMDIWGGGTTTVSNVVAIRDEDISRAQQLGLGIVTLGQVTATRGI